MTYDEKRIFVDHFCFTQNNCDLCPCIDLCDTSPNLINCMTEEELDEMIDAIKNAKQSNDEVEQELHECENRVAFSQSYEDMIGKAVYVKFRINSIGIDKNGVRYNLVSDMEIGGHYMQLNCVKAEVFERGAT